MDIPKNRQYRFVITSIEMKTFGKEKERIWKQKKKNPKTARHCILQNIQLVKFHQNVDYFEINSFLWRHVQ